MKIRSLRLLAPLALAASLFSSCTTQKQDPEVIVLVKDSELETEAIDFNTDVRPILQRHCVRCHNGASQLTSLSFESHEAIMEATKERPIIVPGKPTRSTLFLVTQLPEYFVEAMPADGHQLSDEETWIIFQWIEQGAQWPQGDEGKLEVPKNQPFLHKKTA